MLHRVDFELRAEPGLGAELVDALQPEVVAGVARSASLIVFGTDRPLTFTFGYGAAGACTCPCEIAATACCASAFNNSGLKTLINCTNMLCGFPENAKDVILGLWDIFVKTKKM